MPLRGRLTSKRERVEEEEDSVDQPGGTRVVKDFHEETIALKTLAESAMDDVDMKASHRSDCLLPVMDEAPMQLGGIIGPKIPSARPEQQEPRAESSRGCQGRQLHYEFHNDPIVQEAAEKYWAIQQARKEAGDKAREKARDEAMKEPCGNCKVPGHRVRDCVHPCLDGFVHGCPLCNASDHELSDGGCKKTWPTKLKRRLQWAVKYRGNRPPLAAFPNWFELVLEAKQNGIAMDGMSFPWRPAYPDFFMETNPCPWTAFDYAANDVSALPSDPATASLNVVVANQCYLAGIAAFIDPLAAGHLWYSDMEEDPLGYATIVRVEAEARRLDRY